MKPTILMVAAMLVLSCITAGQAAEDTVSRMYDIYDTQSLRRAVPQQAREAVGNLSIDRELTLDSGLENMFEHAVSLLNLNFKSGLRMFIALLLTSILAGLAGGLWGVTKTLEQPVAVAGVLAVATVSLGDFHQLAGLTRETVQQIEDFSKTLLPVMASAAASSGAPAGAVARHAATMLFSDILITAINRFLIPGTYAYIAVLTADAALANRGLSAVANFLKWGIGGLLKLMLTLYTAYLTITGIIAGSSDAVLEKGARLAISGMVPVVGGILSEASQTIIAGAGVVRTTIGIFGLIAVLGIMLTPLVRLGLQYLTYRFAAMVCAPAAPAPLMQYIENLADVFGLMLAMTVSSSVMLLVAIVSCMQAGM